jgi:hypothetical protein
VSRRIHVCGVCGYPHTHGEEDTILSTLTPTLSTHALSKTKMRGV